MNTHRCLANNKKGAQCAKPAVLTTDHGEPVCKRHHQIGRESIPEERRYIAYKGLASTLIEPDQAEQVNMRHLHNESLSFTAMHEGHELRVHLYIDHIKGTLAITPQRFMFPGNEDPIERRDRQFSSVRAELFGFINGTDPDKWKCIASIITQAADHGHARLLQVKAAKLRSTIEQATAK